MAATDILNMSNTDHSTTSSELLHSMVADAVAQSHSSNYAVKLEPDENNEVEDITSTSFVNSITNSLFSSVNSYNNGSPLISTNGIAQIPAELNAPSTSKQEADSKPISYMQQIKRSRTRIFHDPSSKNQPFSISRPSSRYVHIECTVHVPRTTELPRTNGIKSPPSSPIVHSNKRSPAANFATWLNDHFKLNGHQMQQQGKAQQANNNRSTLHQTINGSPPKQSTQKEQNAKPLPDFVIQFANKNTKTPTTSGLISSARTVNIPANEEEVHSNAQKQTDNQLNSRKSQRLLEKTEELRNRQVVNAQSGDRQYKELKGELARIRKQMSRDRRRLLDEIHQFRQDFSSLRQTVLDAVKLPCFETKDSSPPSQLNEKRRHSTEPRNEGEPSPKKHC